MTDQRPDQGTEGRPPEPPAGEKKRATRFLAGRMWGAATLKGEVIRDTSEDRFATFQSLQVVLLAGLSAAMSGRLVGGETRFGLVAAIAAWLAWVYVAHLASTRALGADHPSTNANRLMRSGGMAMTPAIFLLFSSVPSVGLTIFAVIVVWLVIAMTGAVRFTYEYGDRSKAIQASAAGFGAAALVYAGIMLVFG